MVIVSKTSSNCGPDEFFSSFFVDDFFGSLQKNMTPDSESDIRRRKITSRKFPEGVSVVNGQWNRTSPLVCVSVNLAVKRIAIAFFSHKAISRARTKSCTAFRLQFLFHFIVLLICTAEKSFSTKKRVKNFLRNKMGSYSLSITGKYQLSRPPPPPQFSPGYVFFQYKRVLVCYAKQKVGEVFVHTKIKNRKKGKKRVQTYPKAAWSQSRRCHCTGCKSRAQITSTRITITHHTSTGYSGILTRMSMSALSSALRSVI
ncbi:hypothetical protein J6590_104767 [Homalodisca vitripennis]|nr:hypothetical protein J6590_104767 [Homalodisca vitripennis]